MRKEKEPKLKRALRTKKKVDALVLALRTDHETQLEFGWRDKRLEPFSRWWRTHGLTANHMTYIGFFCVIMAGYAAAYSNPVWVLVYGLLGFLSDALDGAIARWVDPATGKNNVTGWGTFLDHTRDGELVSVFAIKTIIGTVTIGFVPLFTGFELPFLMSIATTYALIGVIAWSLLKKAYQEKKAEGSAGFISIFFAFCLEKMQTSVWGRIQFGLAATAEVTLFMGIYFGIDFFRILSYPLFGAAIITGFRNIVTERWEVDE